MPRYKLTIEYEGTPFSGWQVQKNGPSVQGALRDAIRAFAREDVTPRGAGRTDAGVHALAQIAHIDLKAEWTPEIVMRALNHHLRPQPISV
ncbi:MAG: tRNA pseudouridine(38-40) synthase TruA, partial [Chitinophagales bacterium]|nr:tRNA pseudouridine(38-40) synthase TruA [Hyphomicrobiales bacterium]